MKFLVLGSLELRTDDDAPVPLTGPKRRALLALLVLNAGEVLSGARIADDLWGDAPPKSWPTTLQTFVYQLRRRYGVEELVTTPGGYVLDVKPDVIDARRFERELHAAREVAAQAPERAVALLAGALALWRGAAYEEVQSEPWAIAAATRLEQLRLEAVETWAMCSIGARRPAGVSAELEAWTNRHPLRESLWALRLVALAEEGRPAEALRVAHDLRTVLRDELGADPGPVCADIETRLLRGEPLPPWHEFAGLTPLVRAPAASSQRRWRSPVARLRAGAEPGARVADRFVGRAAELETLRHAFEAVCRGEPRAVAVTGAAGVGKSRLLNEFTPGAVAGGALLLWGACQEDTAVPYLPIATALATLLGDRNPFEAGLVDRGSGGDDGARLALYVSVTRALLQAATERIVLLVVEDVHWADDATLGLLRHLLAVGSEDAARERAQLMIVMTSRPPGPGNRADAIVGRLRRAARAHVVDLPPLAADEVRDLATDWLGKRPAPPTVDALQEAAGGNPLVLRSILARLRENEGRAVGDAVVLIGPTDLDRELWQRLERVGDDCRTLLVQAAVLGDGDRLQSLSVATGLGTDVVDELVDEAAGNLVLFADDERYWFDHPQLRQLVYYATSRQAREACHQQVAERLASAGVDIVVVAHHLARAGSGSDPARTLEVCGEAADRAASIGAWSDALSHGLVALEAAEKCALDPADLASMHLRVARAALLARDRELAMHHLTVAADLGESCRSLATWGAAVVHLARESVEDREAYASTPLALGRVEKFLAAAGDDEPALRALAHALQAEVYSDRDLASAREHAELAERIAAGIDDAEVRAKVLFARGVQHLMAVEFDAARQCLENARSAAERLTDPSPRNWCTGRLGLLAYARGSLKDAEGLLTTALASVHEADNPADYSFVAAVSASVSTVRGHFARCEEDGERARDGYRLGPYWFTPGILYPTLAAARAGRGDLAAAHAALNEWEAVHERAARRYRPLIEAILGNTDAARAAFESNPFRLMTRGRADFMASGPLAAQVLLGALLGEPDLVREPIESLTALYERGMRFSVGWPAHLARVIALGHDTLAESDDAKSWFERALADARARGSDAELARTALDYGRSLDSHGDAGGDDMLAFARSVSSALSMPEHAPKAATPAVTRAVLVTDLVGSTSLNNRLGDHEYLALLREHDAVIRKQLAVHDGVEFKHTGDGIAAWFFSASGALRCATAVREEFERRRAAGSALQVKIAVSAGEPTPVDGDLLGLSVTAAFRALESAAAGEIIATVEIVGLARGQAWSFESRGLRPLKGFPAPVELFAVSSGASQR